VNEQIQSARVRAIAIVSLIVVAIALGSKGDIFSFLFILLLPWMILGLPVAVLYRARAHWRAWEGLVPLFAFVAWMLATVVVPVTKSMSNAIELPIVGILLSILTWVRVAAAGRVPVDVLRRLTVAVAVLLSVMVALVVPTLPE
jgi:hypothetical protein